MTSYGYRTMNSPSLDKIGNKKFDNPMNILTYKYISSS